MALQIDLSALRANYRALAALAPGARAAGVVKADGYGLGAGVVAQALAQEGASDFFVALASEVGPVRAACGPGPASSCCRAIWPAPIWVTRYRS